MDVNQDLLDLLECPVCTDTMYPPVYQCRNGHNICSNCKSSVIRNCCPTCQDEMLDIRSLVLEKMAACLQLPCQYHSSGCGGLYKYDAKQDHEQICRFRPHNFTCPCSACLITGDAPTLVTHLENDHQSDSHHTSEINSLFRHDNPYNGETASMNVAVYNCLGEHFCLHFEAFHSPQDMIYMAFLAFVGDELDAMNFRYSLEVGNDSRKMMWQGMPRSIREGVDQIRESHDGLIIHRSVAQNFAEINSMEQLGLRVRGLIWREEILSIAGGSQSSCRITEENH